MKPVVAPNAGGNAVVARYVLVWTRNVLSAVVTVCLAAAFVSAWALEESPRRALEFGTSLTRALHLLKPATYDDSWLPMWEAYRITETKPGVSPYTIFHSGELKFQYPPASLFLFDAITWHTEVAPTAPLNRTLLDLLDNLSRAGVATTIAASSAIVAVMLGIGRPRRRYRLQAVTVALFGCLGLVFFPLTFAYELGQIQPVITGLVSVGVLLTLRRWEPLAGVAFALCALVKPQMGIILIWAMFRRRWGMALSMTGVLLIGMVASLFRFGLDSHLDYLNVLQSLARVGESYWLNQSVNGVMHRFLENGVIYVTNGPSELPPYLRTVHIATQAAAIVLMALALVYRRPRSLEPGVAVTTDLSVILVVATIASPVAWNHHYSVLLPVFALVIPQLASLSPRTRQRALLVAGIAFTLIAVEFWRPQLIFTDRWRGLLGSHVLAGGLVLLGQLIWLRGCCVDENPSEAPAVLATAHGGMSTSRA